MNLDELKVEESCLVKNHIVSLVFIYQLIKEERDEIMKLIQCGKNELHFEIVRKIRRVAGEVYSACEVINQMLISIYRNDDRYRGTQLKRGFNDNFKEIFNSAVKNNKDLNGIYNDKFISKFFFNAQTWYIEIHDIRTQETHYEVGKIIKIDDQIYYSNGNRNGVSKTLYTNPDSEIRIEIGRFIKLIDSFILTEVEICEFVESYNSRMHKS